MFLHRKVPVLEVKRDSFRLTMKLAGPGYARVNFAIICTGNAAKYKTARRDELVVVSGPKSLPTAPNVAPATFNFLNVDNTRAAPHGVPKEFADPSGPERLPSVVRKKPLLFWSRRLLLAIIISKEGGYMHAREVAHA